MSATYSQTAHNNFHMHIYRKNYKENDKNTNSVAGSKLLMRVPFTIPDIFP